MPFEEMVKLVPQGYEWLLRSDEKHGFFCNMVRSNTIPKHGNTFPCYGNTIENAFMGSLTALMNDLGRSVH